MFQSFEATTRPEQGPPRLAALRAEMAAEGLDGFLVPRADAHQGEYVAPWNERLAWLTGFTGSAGFLCALTDGEKVDAERRRLLTGNIYGTRVEVQHVEDVRRDRRPLGVAALRHRQEVVHPEEALDAGDGAFVQGIALGAHDGSSIRGRKWALNRRGGVARRNFGLNCVSPMFSLHGKVFI